MTSYWLDNCLEKKEGMDFYNWVIKGSCVYALPRHIYMQIKMFASSLNSSDEGFLKV